MEKHAERKSVATGREKDQQNIKEEWYLSELSNTSSAECFSSKIYASVRQWDGNQLLSLWRREKSNIPNKNVFYNPDGCFKRHWIIYSFCLLCFAAVQRVHAHTHFQSNQCKFSLIQSWNDRSANHRPRRWRGGWGFFFDFKWTLHTGV